MQQACLLCSGQLISRMACIDYLALVSTALIRVGWRGGCSSLFLNTRTGTVSFFPLSIFIRCPSFIYCLQYFHAFKHVACFLVGPLSLAPSLDAGLSVPRFWYDMQWNLVELFWFHLLGGAQSRENRKVII